jgi:hypothetical protein
MSKEDQDVCDALRTLLEDEDVDILLSARVKELSGKSGDAVSIIVDQNGTKKTLRGSHVLVAAGRTPNTEGLGLDSAGVELTDRGYIKVNERLQTTAPGCGQSVRLRVASVYTYQPGRFSRRPCESNRRQPCDYGQTGSLLPVHGSGIGARWIK